VQQRRSVGDSPPRTSATLVSPPHTTVTVSVALTTGPLITLELGYDPTPTVLLATTLLRAQFIRPFDMRSLLMSM
jgi:hypothetical protein